MNSIALKRKVKRFVADARPGLALDLLLSNTNHFEFDMQNDIISINAKYKNIEKLYMMGQITFSEYSIESAKVNQAILIIVSEIKSLPLGYLPIAKLILTYGLIGSIALVFAISVFKENGDSSGISGNNSPDTLVPYPHQEDVDKNNKPKPSYTVVETPKKYVKLENETPYLPAENCEVVIQLPSKYARGKLLVNGAVVPITSGGSVLYRVFLPQGDYKFSLVLNQDTISTGNSVMIRHGQDNTIYEREFHP